MPCPWPSVPYWTWCGESPPWSKENWPQRRRQLLSSGRLILIKSGSHNLVRINRVGGRQAGSKLNIKRYLSFKRRSKVKQNICASCTHMFTDRVKLHDSQTHQDSRGSTSVTPGGQYCAFVSCIFHKIFKMGACFVPFLVLFKQKWSASWINSQMLCGSFSGAHLVWEEMVSACWCGLLAALSLLLDAR